MVKWTKAGLFISGDELDSEHGKVFCQMSDEIARLNRDLEWWRNCAMGVLWQQALHIEEEF